MTKTKLIVLSVLLITSLIGGMLFSAYFGAQNQEIDLRTQTVAQEKKCSVYFDKMWKILQQKTSIADQYKEAFKEIYPKLIEGRYSKGDGSLMKWITESNPEFKTSMYEDLMKSIEIERTGFFNEQSRLIDMQREHESFIKKFPNRLFLPAGIEKIEIKLITSSTTENVYKTGKEDDVDLFNKK